MSYGQRIDHQSGGFSDRAIALGMAIHFLSRDNNIPTLKAMTTRDDPYVLSGSKIIDDWKEDKGGLLTLKIR